MGDLIVEVMVLWALFKLNRLSTGGVPAYQKGLIFATACSALRLVSYLDFMKIWANEQDSFNAASFLLYVLFITVASVGYFYLIEKPLGVLSLPATVFGVVILLYLSRIVI